MEKPFQSPHVPHSCFGDDNALKAPRYVVRHLICRSKAGDGKQVANRNDADELACIHHREVTVAMVGQACPGSAGFLLGPEGVRIGGHPEPGPLATRIEARRRRPEQVAFRQDADRLVMVDDDDGS